MPNAGGPPLYIIIPLIGLVFIITGLLSSRGGLLLGRLRGNSAEQERKPQEASTDINAVNIEIATEPVPEVAEAEAVVEISAEAEAVAVDVAAVTIPGPEVPEVAEAEAVVEISAEAEAVAVDVATVPVAKVAMVLPAVPKQEPKTPRTTPKKRSKRAAVRDTAVSKGKTTRMSERVSLPLLGLFFVVVSLIMRKRKP